MPEQHPSVPFDVALRGYDRDQVDAHLSSLDSEFSSVLSERDRLAAQVRALTTRVEELHLQPAGEDGADGGIPNTGSSLDGFGARVEKILRIAEQEAAEVREQARE